MRESGAPFLRRILDATKADREFRHSVEDLQSRIRKSNPSGVLPIQNHGQADDYYYIDYKLDGTMQTLPEYFLMAFWLDRLQLAKEILDYYDTWRKMMTAPIGLHAGSLVVCQTGTARYEPRLVPCPPVPSVSAYELLQADPALLSAIAPERIRGMPMTGLHEDIYAAGDLLLQAMGWQQRRGCSPADSVEMQACGLLLEKNENVLAADTVLRQIHLAQARLADLEKAAQSARHFSPLARPSNFDGLIQVCSEVLAFSHAIAFTKQILANGKTSDALNFLEWCITVSKRNDEDVHRLAADISRDLHLSVKELQHVEAVLHQSPRDTEMAQRRWRLRYDAYMNRDLPADVNKDSEGLWLLNEAYRLRPHETSPPLLEQEIEKKKEYWTCVAMIHSRRGELYKRIQALYELSKLEYKDVESLLLYGLAMREMANNPNMETEYRSKLLTSINQLGVEAKDRLWRLSQAGFIDERVAQKWTELLQFLLRS